MRKRVTALFGVAAVVLLATACAQTDAGVTTKVKAKLAADDTVKAYQIDVDTQNKIVTLSGSVDSAAAKDRAVGARPEHRRGGQRSLDQSRWAARPRRRAAKRREWAVRTTASLAVTRRIRNRIEELDKWPLTRASPPRSSPSCLRIPTSGGSRSTSTR